MLHNLEVYLKDAVGPDMYDVIRDAHDSIESIGGDAGNDEFEEILMLDSSVEDGDTQQAIINLTLQIQLQILGEHGIVMNDQARLQEVTRMVRAIVAINAFEDSNQLMQTAALEMSPNECLAEVVGLVMGESVDDVMMYLDSVSSALIRRIREIATKEEELQMTEQERSQHQRHVDDFIRFTNYINDTSLRICNVLANGVGVGFPYLVYANMVGRDFEIMTAERAAHEMIGMAIVSSDGLLSPRTVISSNIDKFVADIDRVTKITIIANDILLRMKL